jgi:DHA1 family tetracycline resistance protein-like MFS transporter
MGGGVTAFVFYGLAQEPWQVYAGIVFGALSGMAGAAMQTLATQRVGPEDQGKLQGALGGLAGFAALIGPAVFANTFAFFISPAAPFALPGAAFLLAAGFLLLSAFIAWRALRF